jgi:UrcA family protein
VTTLSGIERPYTGFPTLVVVSCCCSGNTLSPIDSDGIRRATVRFADLNLSRIEDVLELYRRIEYAARKVCVDHVRGWDDCYWRAVSNAIARLDRPVLTNVFRSKRAMGAAGSA